MKHYHVIYHHIYVLTIVDDPQIYISNLASNNENVNPRIYADSGCPFGILYHQLTGATSEAGTDTLPGHLSSPLVVSGVRVTRSLVLCVCFINHCLSICTFSFGHCIVCSSSIYRFWLSLWYLQTRLDLKGISSCFTSGTRQLMVYLNVMIDTLIFHRSEFSTTVSPRYKDVVIVIDSSS
jgi:hypothetical protein